MNEQHQMGQKSKTSKTRRASKDKSSTKHSKNKLLPIPTLLLRGHLRHYQHVGMHWLVKLYDTGVNGILADEMGLGKTVQTIATFCYLAVNKGIWGPHLVIVPSAVVFNWKNELQKWAPGLKTLVYHGSVSERQKLRNKWSTEDAFHVCVVRHDLLGHQPLQAFAKLGIHRFGRGAFDQELQIAKVATAFTPRVPSAVTAHRDAIAERSDGIVGVLAFPDAALVRLAPGLQRVV
ncbi:unnamed protein product [Amoebophrya sp. A120]|nr:unnamed protein product [Amoebophrya sp. A120]|eukprot:GSA120T00019861001.1